jgi:hypothetical protein
VKPAEYFVVVTMKLISTKVISPVHPEQGVGEAFDGARLTNTRLMAAGYSTGFGRSVSSQPSCRRELGDPIDREVGQAGQDRAKIVADRDF